MPNAFHLRLLLYYVVAMVPSSTCTQHNTIQTQCSIPEKVELVMYYIRIEWIATKSVACQNRDSIQHGLGIDVLYSRFYAFLLHGIPDSNRFTYYKTEIFSHHIKCHHIWLLYCVLLPHDPYITPPTNPFASQQFFDQFSCTQIHPFSFANGNTHIIWRCI